MKRIRLDNRNRIWYYGNPVGYVKEQAAYVDKDFQAEELRRELADRRSLEVRYESGLLEQLVNGNWNLDEDGPQLKSVRIWQLKPNVDITIKFISYGELAEKFGEPEPGNYHQVFDGELGTNDLEEIFSLCNEDVPYQGHSLSMSDVIELYDKDGSEFYYVDRFGFQEIQFSGQHQETGMEIGLQLM